MCTPISILPDNRIEQEEDFTVALALVTAIDSLGLGNNATAVTITDDDGTYKKAYPCTNMKPSFVSHSVVSFAIPTTAMVIEGGPALNVCVLMTATSTAATLGIDVIVILSTEDGTGTWVCAIILNDI